MADEIKAGDVVELISGGPRMTVSEVAEAVGGAMSAWCVWFEGVKKYDGTFPIVALKLSGPSSSRPVGSRGSNR